METTTLEQHQEGICCCPTEPLHQPTHWWSGVKVGQPGGQHVQRASFQGVCIYASYVTVLRYIYGAQTDTPFRE